jgi:hypothetical protein
MSREPLIGRVLLRVLGVGAYLALVVVLYRQWLTNLGAVAIIVALLFLFKTVVDSGAISIAHLSPWDPQFDVGPPKVELSKTLSFLGVGLGAWIDLGKATETMFVPASLPTSVIHLVLVCGFAICVVSCLVRLMAALSNRAQEIALTSRPAKIGCFLWKGGGIL